MLATQNGVGVGQELLARLGQARLQTDKLFDQVKPEFLYERPIPERHRIVFYVGHLEAFDWNLLRERVLGPVLSIRNLTTCLRSASIRWTEGYRRTSRRTGLLWRRCASMSVRSGKRWTRAAGARHRNADRRNLPRASC